jgi:hypothetical protein
MALTTAQGSAAYLNRALNNANATPTAFAATVADLTTDEMAAADKFDVATLTDAQMSTQVLTNMGILPSTDAAVLALETELAAYFGGMGKGHRGFVVLQLARIVADKVGDATYGAAATAWNTEVAASLADSTDQAISLTTSLTDVATGGQGSDIFTAITAALASANTLNSTDKISGGTGNDVLNVNLGSTFDGFTVGTGSLGGVETVNLTNSGTVARSFAAKGVTDVTTYNIVGEVNVANLDNVATRVNLKSIGATSSPTVTIGHNSEAVVGLADSKTIGLEALGGVVSATTNRPVVNVDGVEYLSVVSSGTATNYVKLTDSTIKTLTISGAAPLNTTGLGGSTITSVDGSAATGVLTLDLADGASKGIRTVKTGTANDAITIAVNDDVAVNATIDAGAGANKIVLKGSAANVEYLLSGVQTVELDAITGALNFSGAKATTAIDTILVKTAAGATTSNFSGMGAGAVTVNVTSDLNGSTTALTHGLTTDHSGAATVNVTVSSAATAAATQSTADTVTLTKATAVTLVTGKNGVYTGNITADKATAFTATIGGEMRNTLQGAEVLTATVSQTDKDITASTLALNTDKLTSLDLTIAGGLAVTPSTTALTKVNTLKVATDVAFGSNALDFTGVNTVTLSGAATTSAVTLGALGSSTQGYGISLTATGERAGLTLGSSSSEGIKVAADQAISLDVSAVTGNRYIAHDGTTAQDIAVTSGATGSVTVNAAGSGITGKVLNIGNTSAKTISVDVSNAVGNTVVGTMTASSTGGAATLTATGLTGTLSVGHINAKTVTANLNNVSGAVTLAQLTGDSVTVNAADAAAGVTNSANATVKNALSYTGSSAAANTLDTTLAASSTAFTATLNGGFLQDQYSITSTQSGQTSITVSGNLGNYVSGSADSLIVTSTNSAAAAGQTIDISGLTVATGATSTIRGAFATTNLIKGGAGNDTIYGGSKADVIYLGTGTDTYVMNNTVDTGTVATSKIASGSAITAGGNTTTTGLDVVYNFSTGDKLELGLGLTATVDQYVYGTTVNIATSKAQLVSGNYDSAAATFTFAASGRDSLVVYDGNADTTDAFQAIVLVGYVTTTATAYGTTGLTGVAA